MAQSQIKWKRGDYIRLGRAVSDFNKKINELQQEENKLYLPTPLAYSNVKENITTRQELNRMINSLRRFQREDAGELYITEAGEQITKWERRELGYQVSIAKRRLNKELASLNEPTLGGFSRVQMGSVRAREIEAQIKSLGKLENKTGFEFNRLKKSIRFQGASDYTMKKSIVYRENYINEMKKYSNFDNYDKLMNKLQSISNPISFYDFVSKNELTKDLTYNSDMFYSQAEFNRFVSDLLGEEMNDQTDIVKDFMDFKYETFKNDEMNF
jgi:hypothetical protein